MSKKPIHHTYTAKSWQFKLSFWLVVVIGVALSVAAILNFIFKDAGWANAMANWVQSICFAIGMFIPVSMSWQVVKYKSTLWKVLWVIFVILIVVGLVFRILGHF
ncbi:MAG: hypothetical protein J1F39_07595 [Clostridiales bacterium]|nr:hypothetical protein [Clostridiales bacterium]